MRDDAPSSVALNLGGLSSNPGDINTGVFSSQVGKIRKAD